MAGARAPTRGGRTGGWRVRRARVGVRGAYEGTHKGCPYGWIGGGRRSWRVRGHPRGVVVRVDGG